MTPIIQLEEFFLTRLEITLPEPDGKVNRPQGIRIEDNIATNTENPLLFKVELGVRYHPDFQEGLPDGPCIEAKIVGVFSCPEEMEEAKRFPMVRYNGSLILYGLLRGQVATVTGSFPTGKLTLPSFNMMEVLKMNDDRSKEKSKGPAIPKKRLSKSSPSKPVKSRGKSK